MISDYKTQAAAKALELVADGARIGLGTGSTAEAFVRLIAERIAGGLKAICVPTSERTAELATSLGIRLSSLDETPELDITVDGADEIGPDLALIKGGGAALLREKIVAFASRRMVVIADSSKLVAELGTFPLPIEVTTFGLEATRRAIIAAAGDLGLSGSLLLRKRGAVPLETDGGNRILDASFRQIPQPERLAQALSAIPGVVEHGLFIDIASEAIIAGPDGIRHLTR